MSRVRISYTDCEGKEKTQELEGDFHLGREKTSEGPRLSIRQKNGSTIHLWECPMTVSRLKMGQSETELKCHARFFWEEGVLQVQDMGSTNGTKMEGSYLRGWSKKVKSDPVPIKGRSLLQVGELEFYIEPVMEERTRVKPPSPLDEISQKIPPFIPGINGQPVIIVNYGTIDQGTHSSRSVGSQNFDVVANRSSVKMGDDAEDGSDEVINRGRSTSEEDKVERKKKRKIGLEAEDGYLTP